MDKLVTACNTKVEEGMEILTNSPKVRVTRKINVELLLSDHDCKCVQCVKSGNCTLQKIANDLGIISIHYDNTAEKNRWDFELPLIREASKCIKCMRCVQICDKVQGLNVWDINGSGYRTNVGVARNKPLTEADCALCGQCITHCPVGALRARDDRGTIGKRYRRQDEIGTPFCVTYDFDSEEDHAVTVRDRDTMEQERIPIAELDAYFAEKFEF